MSSSSFNETGPLKARKLPELNLSPTEYMCFNETGPLKARKSAGDRDFWVATQLLQ